MTNAPADKLEMKQAKKPQYRYSRSVVINAPIDDVFHFHDNTDNLLKITPPSIKVAIESRGTPGLGYEVRLRVRQFGVMTMNWHVRITEYVAPTRMVDEQVRGPFTLWRQIRDLRTVPGGTELCDTVEYSVPFGILGRLANRLVIHREITRMFAHRQQATKQLLEASV